MFAFVRGRGGLGLAVLVSTLALAGPAQAASLTKSGSTLIWTSGAAGVSNNLTINYEEPLRGICGVFGGDCDPSYSFTDTAEAVTVTAGECTPAGTSVAGTRIVCESPGDAPIGALIVSPGPGNDTVAHDQGECTTRCLRGADVPVPMTITGADGDDTLNGSVAGDALSGGNGSDTLSGEGGSDTLTGAAGDDTLTPGLGDDNLVDGGTESDTVSYDDGRSSGVTVTLNDGSAGNDGGPDDGAAGSREAVVNTESLVGSAQADVLTGDGAFNTIDALAGNDSIRGGVGQDDLNGSTGTDTVDYGDHGAPVTVTLDASNAFKNGSSGENDRTAGFETVLGGAAGDTLTSAYPAGTPARLEGAGGADSLTGGASDDTLVGGGGSDVVNGQGGVDTALYPVAEGVAVTLNNGAAKDDGGAGDGAAGARDSIAAENVTGGSGPDVLVGDGGPNALSGGGGDDSLQGGQGTDALSGGAGRDRVSYEERASSQPVDVSIDGLVNDGASGENDVLSADFEVVAGGSGADHLAATAAPGVELIGNSGDDELFAPNGGGTVQGGNGNDEMTGGDGEDTLDGGLGDDAIDGLGGADAVRGGGGDDSIEARDGAADGVDCGSDTDTALTDSVDARTDCELPAAPVQEPAGGGGAPAGGAPSGGGAPAGGGVPSGGGTPPAIVGQRDPERILVIFGFAFSKSTAKFTRFTTLQVKAVPIGATLTAVCTAPKGKKCPAKSFTKKNAFGTVNLGKWVKKKLPAGSTLTVTVTKPGAFIGAVKTLKVNKKKAPAIGTRCLPPGAKKSVGC